MIKFFRRIRQNLLVENKFSRYLIYAIGEIVLVVIGILIALHINNWNNERISNKRSIDFMESLVEDLITLRKLCLIFAMNAIPSHRRYFR